MARADFRFAYRKRVRYNEIDAQAVLFNARFLDYFDIGITEYWRAVGLRNATGPVSDFECHVAKAVVEFKAPVVLDEEIDICVRCSAIGNSSMTFLFELHGAGADDLRASGEEVSVHVAEARGRPQRVPDAIVAQFETFEGRMLRRRAEAAE